ncbi:hypothetical protein NXH67_02605 [Butyrivibrio sp. DSM 10294]|nr:hypothetical protein [Butyrivibrio sp. DSM 10294]MDC7292410.1 hypothetical protein [Butyrivibrio sp. DSM 10294]
MKLVLVQLRFPEGRMDREAEGTGSVGIEIFACDGAYRFMSVS